MSVRVNYKNIIHLIVVITFFMVAFSAIMNQTFYSKEAIMQTFEYSFPMIGLDIPPTDQLFIARLERRVGWIFHFHSALALSVSFLLLIVLSYKKRIFLFLVLFLILIMMFATGLILYMRSIYEIPVEYINNARVLHHYMAWGIGLAVVLHISYVIYKTKDEPYILGKRFILWQDCFECHSKNKLISSSRPEHQAIWECSMCHNDEKKVIF